MDIDYDFEVKKLSHLFYNDYPMSLYPDILRKNSRSYNIVLVDLHCDYYICIPFRSKITHEFAYMFRNSIRSQSCLSGLDYTKICIIKNPDYIDDSHAVVDQDEYVEMRNNIDVIIKGAMFYINDFINHEKGICVLSNRKYREKYRYSTLKYFKSELGI